MLNATAAALEMGATDIQALGFSTAINPEQLAKKNPARKSAKLASSRAPLSLLCATSSKPKQVLRAGDTTEVKVTGKKPPRTPSGEQDSQKPLDLEGKNIILASSDNFILDEWDREIHNRNGELAAYLDSFPAFISSGIMKFDFDRFDMVIIDSSHAPDNSHGIILINFFRAGGFKGEIYICGFGSIDAIDPNHKGRIPKRLKERVKSATAERMKKAGATSIREGNKI